MNEDLVLERRDFEAMLNKKTTQAALDKIDELEAREVLLHRKLAKAGAAALPSEVPGQSDREEELRRSVQVHMKRAEDAEEQRVRAETLAIDTERKAISICNQISPADRQISSLSEWSDDWVPLREQRLLDQLTAAHADSRQYQQENMALRDQLDAALAQLASLEKRDSHSHYLSKEDAIRRSEAETLRAYAYFSGQPMQASIFGPATTAERENGDAIANSSLDTTEQAYRRSQR